MLSIPPNSLSLIVVAILIVTLPVHRVRAADSIPNDEVIRIVGDVEEAYMAALSSGEIDEAAAMFTEAATHESEWGTVLKGRDVIRNMLRNVINARGLNETWSSRPTHSAAVTTDVIVTHGVTFNIFNTGVTERLFHTRVLVRTADGWRIAAEQLARPSTLPQSGSAMP